MDAHSALQAEGNAWGGYMNSDDWMNNGQNMTIRYDFSFDKISAPRPFSSLNGSNPKLLVETNLAVTKYTGKKISEKTGSIGYSVLNVVFMDMRNNKLFILNARIFDWRGFATAYDSRVPGRPDSTRIGGGSLKEGVGRAGTSEMCVGTHFGPGTKYITLESGSSTSLIAPWSDKQHFAYSITRDHFENVIIRAINAWLDLNERDSVRYSSDPNDYILQGVGVGIEGTRLTPSTDHANKLEVSYIGDSLNITMIPSSP